MYGSDESARNCTRAARVHRIPIDTNLPGEGTRLGAYRDYRTILKVKVGVAVREINDSIAYYS